MAPQSPAARKAPQQIRAAKEGRSASASERTAPPSFLPETGEGGMWNRWRLVEAFLEAFVLVGRVLRGDPDHHLSTDALRKRLLELMVRADARRKEHGIPDAGWKSALLAVCVTLDERIACSGWEGRDLWKQQQLQRQLFGTSQGGELFFRRLAELDPEDDQVREVFAYCLALGFQGRLHGEEGRGRLLEIRMDNLRRLVNTPEPGLPEQLFPASGLGLRAEERRRIPRLRRVVQIVLFMLSPAIFLLAWWTFHTVLETQLRPFLS